jgi:5'-nucleotidase (lipoprotein e(P4) family)
MTTGLTRLRSLTSWIAVTFAAACATSPAATPSVGTAPAAVSAPTVGARVLPNDIRWVSNSAEYRALALQTYRTASERVSVRARAVEAGRWGVILDADETVLDNSEYERRRAAVDSGYSSASWHAWVAERAAVAVPGAVEFIRRVRALGGRVAIVSNRSESECPATGDNLRSIGVEADVVLCQPGSDGDKNPRFARVQNGSAAPGLPPLTIVAWIGDNIQDFPGLSQAARNDPAALAPFGDRYFLVPNPMYGSWSTP